MGTWFGMGWGEASLGESQGSDSPPFPFPGLAGGTHKSHTPNGTRCLTGMEPSFALVRDIVQEKVSAKTASTLLQWTS